MAHGLTQDHSLETVDGRPASVQLIDGRVDQDVHDSRNRGLLEAILLELKGIREALNGR